MPRRRKVRPVAIDPATGVTVSPAPFVGLCLLAAAFFLYAAAVVLAPWWVVLLGLLAWLALVVLAPLTIVGLNRAFYGFLVRKRGTAFAAGSVPLHLLYYGCCGISVVLALGYWIMTGAGRTARKTSPAMKPGEHRPLGSKLRRTRRWIKR